MTARAALGLALLLSSAPACSEPKAPLSDGRYAMGTVLEIWLHGLECEPGHALLEQLFSRAAELESLFTRFDPESELSRLNLAGGGRRSVDPELAHLLAEAIEAQRLTRGTFDVTVGPLIALWWQAAEQGTPPSEAELAEALALVGSSRMRAGLDETGAGWAELEPGMAVDLGGIAKGYALDRLGQLARAGGAKAALLSFGQSSLHAFGAPPGHEGWRVLVRDLAGGFAGVATLRDQSLSISASLGQGFEISGRLYGHVVDPRSGRPLTRRALAAVVAETGSRAEALSKALLLLTPDEGVALLESLPDAEALLLEADGSQRETSGWRAAVRFEPADAQPPR